MGVSIAKNSVMSMISSSNDVFQNFASNCSSKAGTDITDQNKNCKVKIGQININLDTTVNQQCFTSAVSMTSLTQQMNLQFKQAAQAITQNFGFFAASDAESFINTSVDLSNKIVQNFTQSCLSNAVNTLGFICNESDIEISGINITSYVSTYQKCTSDYVAQSDITTTLVQKLQSTTLASEANAFGSFIIVFAFILIVIVYFALQTLSGPIGWLIVFLVIGSVLSGVLYSYFAPQNKYYPYQKAPGPPQ